MKIDYLLLLLIPLLVVLELQWFSGITYLLRQSSDAAVGAGVGLGCLFLTFNTLLIRFLYKTLVKH